MSRAEPFGYYKDKDGNKLVIPNQLEALKQAKYYVDNGCTLRATRDWLVNKTGREISIPGLVKAIKHAGNAEKTNQTQDTEADT